MGLPLSSRKNFAAPEISPESVRNFVATSLAIYLPAGISWRCATKFRAQGLTVLHCCHPYLHPYLLALPLIPPLIVPDGYWRFMGEND